MKDLRSENDNLSDWRKTKAELTEQLMNDAINELINLKATITQKTVCDMMGKLASNEHREFKALITPSAISKNNIYKNMIFEGKKKVQLSENKKQNYKLDGDHQLEVFKLKTLLAKKEAKIKELESIINRAQIQKENISDLKTQKDMNHNQQIFKNLLNDVIQLSLNSVYLYEDNKGNLINEYTDLIVITKEIRDLLEK